MTKEAQTAPASRSIGNLRMVWGYASRYPKIIAGAIIALIIAAAATLAIPNGFRLVIDKGDINLTFKRYMAEPIRLDFKDDYITDIIGDIAQALKVYRGAGKKAA